MGWAGGGHLASYTSTHRAICSSALRVEITFEVRDEGSNYLQSDAIIPVCNAFDAIKMFKGAFPRASLFFVRLETKQNGKRNPIPPSLTDSWPRFMFKMYLEAIREQNFEQKVFIAAIRRDSEGLNNNKAWECETEDVTKGSIEEVAGKMLESVLKEPKVFKI